MPYLTLRPYAPIPRAATGRPVTRWRWKLWATILVAALMALLKAVGLGGRTS